MSTDASAKAWAATVALPGVTERLLIGQESAPLIWALTCADYSNNQDRWNR